MVPLYDLVPDNVELAEYRRTDTTWAGRVEGPFAVKTIHGGVAACRDGWIARDAKGFFYPIDVAVFEQSYVPVED
jgi:hypothetical protein